MVYAKHNGGASGEELACLTAKLEKLAESRTGLLDEEHIDEENTLLHIHRRCKSEHKCILESEEFYFHRFFDG